MIAYKAEDVRKAVYLQDAVDCAVEAKQAVREAQEALRGIKHSMEHYMKFLQEEADRLDADKQ